MYIIKNTRHGNYLSKYFKKQNIFHFTTNIEEAMLFKNKMDANIILKLFKSDNIVLEKYFKYSKGSGINE